jgi:hypothetical protein
MGMGMGAPPPELETLAPAPLKRTQASQKGNEMENGPTGRGAAYDAEFVRYSSSKPGLAGEPILWLQLSTLILIYEMKFMYL